jgi:hypothetical protein
LACSTAFGRLRWCAAVLTRGAETPGPPRLVVAVGPDPAIGGGRRPGPRDWWWPSARTPRFVVAVGPDPAVCGDRRPGPRDWGWCWRAR